MPMLKECAGGDKAGICWVPTSQDPITAARSFARTGHYDPAKAAGRANYDLLVEHAVNRVLVDKSSPNSPPKVEIKAVGGDGKVTVVSPKLEVILAAGAIHTPHILQKSGIGPAALLKEAGIELVVDLPVGYNFQDHGGPEVSVQCKPTPGPDSDIWTELTSYPLVTNDTSASLSQSSFNRDPELTAQARAQYAERPAKGPYTLAMGNTAIYIPLRNITATASFIAGSVVALAASGTKGSPADVYLPPGTPPTVVTGYIAQLKVIADLMNNPEAPYLESPFESAFQGVAAGACMLMHPASRGTVLLDPKNPAAEHPIIDYRSVSAPTDLNVFRQFIKYFRKYYSQSPTLKQLGAVEVSPGANVTSDRDLDAWVRNSMTASFLHPCCTAPMMPQNKGGVVDTTLKVYGVEGLRVVDASMFPLIPGTHTSATVYAVAEKVSSKAHCSA